MLNKKIASEVSIGIISLLAIVVGGIFYWQNQKISELSWHLSQRDQKLSEKSEEVSGLVYRIESIGQTNADLRALVDDLRVQWIDHTRQIQTIESENRFLNQAWHESKLEVVNYALTRSWRITRPMRKIIKAIRGK